MQVTVHDNIQEIPAADWNRLAGSRYPFLRHEFLHLGETSGCVTPELGWSPRHLTIAEGNELRAAMPLYEKSHSWGEFVFDWAWANAYSQAGLNYYPKLVSAAPFTPAKARKLMLADRNDAQAERALLQAAIALAEETGCSSLHVQFPADSELPALRKAGLLMRKDCQFHWHNQNYRTFEDFLATFTSAKRKKAKRDRRKVTENGIRFRRLEGRQIDAETWAIVYRLISHTFAIRGSTPYYNEAFFRGLSQQQPDNILIVLAEHEDRPVAAAVFFASADTLYGRYWGSDGHFDALHFETCYYQGIDYCIESGKKFFEPGTQGEHKISRGFTPVSTQSAHWLAHPRFADAIERYLQDEERHVDQYIDIVDAHSPYKKSGKGA